MRPQALSEPDKAPPYSYCVSRGLQRPNNFHAYARTHSSYSAIIPSEGSCKTHLEQAASAPKHDHSRLTQQQLLFKPIFRLTSTGIHTIANLLIFCPYRYPRKRRQYVLYPHIISRPTSMEVVSLPYVSFVSTKPGFKEMSNQDHTRI